MKTYRTLEEAFVNGSGDCFYKKDDQYVAIHRKDTGIAFDLVCKGWKLMPAGSYTMERYNKQLKEATKVEPMPEPISTIRNYGSYPLFESYADEFPDGVNQSL